MTRLSASLPRLPDVPRRLAHLLRRIADEVPAILDRNLVGIYLWGSLTCGTFDRRRSDVDAVVVTRGDLSRSEFTALARWFRRASRANTWVRRLDMRFVINHEFFDKRSKCCGFYSGRLVRHGSDGNPIIWLNVGRCGVTLCGPDARSVAPPVSWRRLKPALRLELDYLKEDMAKNAGDRSVSAFRHNAYAVLTACRILYTAEHRTIISKEKAYRWARTSLPRHWRAVLMAAWRNRLRNRGTTTPKLEADAAGFVSFARSVVESALPTRRPSRATRTSPGTAPQACARRCPRSPVA